MKHFTIRRQKYQGGAYQLVGYADLTPKGQIVLPQFCEHVADELENSIKYLVAEKAAVSVQTISGYQVEKKS